MTAPIITPDFRDPGAPEDFGTGRKCHRCKQKVSRYQKPHWGGILLCYSCDRERVDKDMEVHLFVGKIKRGRQTSYRLTALQRVRESRGLSRRDLAEDAGVHPGTVRKLERGDLLARERIAGKLARALGVEVKELR